MTLLGTRFWLLHSRRLQRLGAACGATIALLSARPLEACSIALPPPALVGTPANGEVAVPTDVLPLYNAFRAGLDQVTVSSASFELIEDSGTTTSLVARATQGYVELTPPAELQPRTTYILRGRWPNSQGSPQSMVDLTLSFTTGDGPLAGVPEPPSASMTHYFFDGSQQGTSCDPPPNGSCIFFPRGTTIELVYVDSFGQDHGPSIYTEPFIANLSGENQGTNFECAKLRTRAANGKLSAPVVLCGKDAPKYELTGSLDIACTQQGLLHHGALVTGNEGKGCSCSIGRRSPDAPAVPALLLGGFWALRRARRSRRR